MRLVWTLIGRERRLCGVKLAIIRAKMRSEAKDEISYDIDVAKPWKKSDIRGILGRPNVDRKTRDI